MQCKLNWFLHALGAWANSPWVLVICAAVIAATAWWLGSRGRRQACWVWLTDEHFYKCFGFLGLLWPQLERRRVWPEVMEEAKIVYLERLEQARLYRGGQLPKWWVALANIRFLLQMAFLVVEMSRAIYRCNGPGDCISQAAPVSADCELTRPISGALPWSGLWIPLSLNHEPNWRRWT